MDVIQFKQVSLTRQIDAVIVAIGQISGKPKLRPAEREMVIRDLNAVLETLRRKQS
jgi:hypothetical protein